MLICSGSLNRTPQTGWLKEQEFIFPQFWRLIVPGQGPVGLGLVSAEEPLPGLQTEPPSCCALTWRRATELSGVSSPKDTHPIRSRLPAYDLISLSVTSLFQTATLGVRASEYDFWGETNTQSTADGCLNT